LATRGYPVKKREGSRKSRGFLIPTITKEGKGGQKQRGKNLKQRTIRRRRGPYRVRKKKEKRANGTRKKKKFRKKAYAREKGRRCN